MSITEIAKNHTIGDESIYMVCQHQALEITDLKHKLAIAIEALEDINLCASMSNRLTNVVHEALNKIRSE
jgi:predicted DNA-binding protein YlxM (UPF0122 family)